MAELAPPAARDAVDVNELPDSVLAWVLLAARISLAMVFLVSGLHKGIWHRKAVEEFRAAGVPLIGVTLPLTIGLHLVGSICLILGLFTAKAALALAVFTVVATLWVHDFWRLAGTERLARSRIALAHLAVVGGLLLLAAVGPGRLAIAW